ncbi:putative ribonuclease H-like domain-containing protein [Tanacetum coccineum]|uniref:Ribonuclease H-like domain-containing protein n=1 Tax=Tanacetum coccineum TaxID=301880 RepID=A0ABQ5BHE1_9ASTR
MTTTEIRTIVHTGKGKMGNNLEKSRWVWRPKGNYLDHVSKDSRSFMLKKFEYANPEIFLQGHAVVDSGCSSHMTGNKAYLSYYEDYNGGFVAFGSDPKGCKIMGKGKIRTANLDFDDVYFVDELNFKLLEESQVVLRAPRKDDVYSLDLKNIVPSRGLENQLNHKVKIIRCDNRIEFKNHVMNELCAKKGIKWEFSVAKTPQQNGFGERKNRTLIEAARTMLADSLLPIPFWAEAVNTACYEYILLPIHPHETSIPVEDVVPATHEKSSESSPKDNDVQDSEDVAEKEKQHQLTKDEQVLQDELEKIVAQEVVTKAMDDATRQAFEEEKRNRKIPIDASTLPNIDLPIDPNMPDLEDDSNAFPNDGIFNRAYDDEDVGAVANFNTMDNTIAVSPIPTLRVHKDHPKGQILGDHKSAVQTRGKIQKASST